MMLTWKIFVTVMSMVSLTLQMKSSHTGSSSNSSSLWKKDRKSGLYYPSSHDVPNLFDPDYYAHVCFALLALYCRCEISEEEEIASDVCAKQGIFFYKITQEDPQIRNENDPISWLDTFFDNFPLNPGDIKLPMEFCVTKDAPEVPMEVEDDIELMSEDDENYILMEEDEKEKPIDPICLAELRAYSEKLQSLWSRNPHFAGANYQSRLEIARFALLHIDTFGMSDDSFEKKYLEHISEAVSSSDPSYNPHIYCKRYEGRNDSIIITHFLYDHLRLRI